MKNLLLATDDYKDLENTQILYKAQKHWISFVLPTINILIGLIGVVFTSLGMGSVKIIGFILLIFLFKGLKTILTNLHTKIFLTEHYLTISQGIFGKSVTDVPLNKLEGVVLSQNFFGKILNYGNLMITTGGFYQKYVIKNPMKLREKIIKPKI